MRTWTDFLYNPFLPVETVFAWPLLGALVALSDTIGVGALIAAICLVGVVNQANNESLRPLIPLSFLVSASIIFATQAWTVGVVLLIALPIAASVFRTIAVNRVAAFYAND